MNIENGKTSPTLRAEMGGHPPIVMYRECQCLKCGERFQSKDEIGGLAPAECPCCGEENQLQVVGVDLYNQTITGGLR